MEQTLFQTLAAVDCSKFTETIVVGGKEYTYLSWSHAWALFCQHAPRATYRMHDVDESELGFMVHSTVTAASLTHEMWLPVLDSSNRTLKLKEYTYSVYNKFEKKYVEKKVDAINMYDINTAKMRCLVKNLAMFGLGLNIYAKEDLPLIKPEVKEEVLDVSGLLDAEKLQKLALEKMSAVPEAIIDRINIVLSSGTEQEKMKMQKYLQGLDVK